MTTWRRCYPPAGVEVVKSGAELARRRLMARVAMVAAESTRESAASDRAEGQSVPTLAKPREARL